MLRQVLLGLIRTYQLLVSPLTGGCCRFEPSCSRYATLCLHHHGVARGSWLTLKRLLRCNPFFAGGIDLPPGVDPKEAEPDWERIAQLTGQRPHVPMSVATPLSTTPRTSREH